MAVHDHWLLDTDRRVFLENRIQKINLILNIL